jgi:arsenate reductase (thioredoxin)
MIKTMNTQYLTTTTYLGYKIMDKSNVLFVCTENSARSQIAEAFLRWYAGDYYNVYSAGLEPTSIHPLTIQVMEELEINMSDHVSKGFQSLVGKMDFAYLITVCDKAGQQCPYFPGMGTRLSWEFDDPARVEGSEQQKLTAFRQVRDQIEVRILNWLAEQGVQAAD